VSEVCVVKQAKEDVEEVEMEEAEGNGASASQQGPSKVWQPGVDEMGEDEELQFDPTAYHCLHSFKLGWPCLRLLCGCELCGCELCGCGCLTEL
jgi:hypothetical protein